MTYASILPPPPHSTFLMFDPPITTTGTLVDSPQAKIYHVSLPNGKIVIGHVSKALVHLHDQLKPGDTLNLELTPYDLTKARIVGIQSTLDEAQPSL